MLHPLSSSLQACDEDKLRLYSAHAVAARAVWGAGVTCRTVCALPHDCALVSMHIYVFVAFVNLNLCAFHVIPLSAHLGLT